MFLCSNFQLYISSTIQILENLQIDADLAAGQKYFEGSVKFMKSLNEVLDMLIASVSGNVFKYRALLTS